MKEKKKNNTKNTPPFGMQLPFCSNPHGGAGCKDDRARAQPPEWNYCGQHSILVFPLYLLRWFDCQLMLTDLIF